MKKAYARSAPTSMRFCASVNASGSRRRTMGMYGPSSCRAHSMRACANEAAHGASRSSRSVRTPAGTRPVMHGGKSANDAWRKPDASPPSPAGSATHEARSSCGATRIARLSVCAWRSDRAGC